MIQTTFSSTRPQTRPQTPSHKNVVWDSIKSLAKNLLSLYDSPSDPKTSSYSIPTNSHFLPNWERLAKFTSLTLKQGWNIVLGQLKTAVDSASWISSSCHLQNGIFSCAISAGVAVQFPCWNSSWQVPGLWITLAFHKTVPCIIKRTKNQFSWASNLSEEGSLKKINK